MTTTNVVKRLVGGASLGAVLMAGAMALGGSATVGAQSATAAENSAVFCQGYAQEAVRRYRDYVRNKCGGRNNIVWSPNYSQHYGWCMRNSANNANWLQDLRYKVLNKQCAGDGFRSAGKGRGN
ncbi:MAG: hypothetical protein R3D62_12785 [Xanthobacteraceae bacterium]